MACGTTTKSILQENRFFKVYVAAIDGVAGTPVEGGLTTRGTVVNAWLSILTPEGKGYTSLFPIECEGLRTSRLVGRLVNADQAVTQFKHVVPAIGLTGLNAKIRKIAHLSEMMMNCAFLVRSLI